MKDIAELLAAPRDARTAATSLSYRLEHAVGGYFVRGGGAGQEKPWRMIYYDPAFDFNDYNSAIALVPENIVACVSEELRLALVRADHLDHFRRDAADYGLAFCPLESLTAAELCCAAPERLPEPMLQAFANAGGTSDLNPKCFSALQLAENMNKNRR